MPTGPVDNRGSVLYYEDSGAPTGSTDYVTLVLVHGTMFHSAIFRHMISFAAACNLRLILLNLRDYPGSSRYSPEELAALSSPERAVQAEAVKTRGLEIAAFIRWFIETEHIPPLSQFPETDGATAGGFALLAWSSGNLQTMPLLAYANEVPEDTRKLFGSYFRSFIVYDTSQTAMGEEPFENLYSPFRDPALTPRDKMAIFPVWVSSYFTQVDIGPEDDSESPGFAAMLLSRTAIHEGDSSSSEGVDPRWTPTVQRMGPEVLAEVCDFGVMIRSQIHLQLVDRTIYQDNLRRALFECELGDGSGEEKVVWPAVRVRMVWCDMSTGDNVFAASKIKHMAGKYSQLQKGRPIEFHRLEKANHFLHWDEPEQFTKFLAEIV